MSEHDYPLHPSNPIFGVQALPGSSSEHHIAAPSRGPAYGARYGVAVDHPLSAWAAMSMLQRGGNAGDATVAAAAMNAVVKPYHTQFGGDAFALVWRKRSNEVEALNAGGLAPKAATLEHFATGIPEVGPQSCTVPGFVDALLEIHASIATLPLDTLLAPAIRACEQGFAVSQRLAAAMTLIPSYDGAEELKRVYLKDGRPYLPGEVLRLPDLAATLKQIVEIGREGFYAEATGKAIVEMMAATGGLITEADLKDKTAVWGEALKTTYAGCDVFEQPLPSQGIILLEALNIIENFPLSDWGPGHAYAIHVMVEAIKLAVSDSRRYSADPLVESVPVETLLSKEHAHRRAREIDMGNARKHEASVLVTDTTEFVVGDEDMAIAFIQSIFSPWGSHVVVPGTGVLLNNRLRAFHTDPASPNALAPGKRTVHTLNTFMAIRDGALVAGGGTPGMDFQVQANLQTVVAVLNWGMDLQAAVDMPRWALLSSGELAMEERFHNRIFDALGSRGHQAQHVSGWDATIARSQIIASTPEGGWGVASDLRGEGVALVS